MRAVSAAEARALATEALTLPTATAVRALLRERVDPQLPDYLLVEHGTP